MQRDDLVILRTGKARSAVVRVIGDYEYRQPSDFPDGLHYQHQRVVEKTAIDPDRLWRLVGAQVTLGQNIRWTLIQCLLAVDAEAL